MRRGASVMRSRRGSSSVFLCVILSALISICFAFIYSTITSTTASQTDALMRLSGQSLLSEFDSALLEEYGLFLLREDDRELSKKLRNYLLFTFGEKPSVTVENVKASSAPFTLSDPEPVKQQILAFMKSGGGLMLPAHRKDQGTMSAAGSSGEAPTSDNSGETPVTGRALRHGPTIASLPSRQLPEGDLLSRAQGFGERLTAAFQSDGIREVFTDGTDRYLLCSYALGMFNTETAEADPDHFFLREAEYLLGGELTDRENLRRTESALRTLRLASNAAHIYSDPAKQEALAAAAEVISPGPAAVLTQAGLTAAWAYAESVNDARLLVSGSRVPLVKNESNWAISLTGVIEGTGDGDGILRPEKEEGLTYGEYLRILLFLENETLLLARMMDLIQINMRKNVDGEFLIGQCSSGLAMEATVNGRDYDYETIYQRLLYR